MTTVNILLRGQSNADLFGSEDIGAGYVPGVSDATGLEYTSYLVSELTGLAVNLIYQGDAGGIASGTVPVSYGGYPVDTAAQNTGLMPTGGASTTWLTTDPSTGALEGGNLENLLIGGIDGLSPSIRTLPTAVLWLWNENDSGVVGALDANSSQGTAISTWENDVSYDMNAVRAAFNYNGVANNNIPYVFINPIPYAALSANSIDQVGEQDIKVAMQQMANLNPSQVTVTANNGDMNMNNNGGDTNIAGNSSVFGGPHLSPYDIGVVAYRSALAVANQFAALANPGTALKS